MFKAEANWDLEMEGDESISIWFTIFLGYATGTLRGASVAVSWHDSTRRARAPQGVALGCWMAPLRGSANGGPMQVFGPNELIKDVLQQDLCIGCGACTELCPYFKNYRGKTGMVFSCTRTQGRCHAHCPKVEVDLDALFALMFDAPYEGEPIGIHRRVLSAKAGPRMTRGKFQAGGVVSALVTYAVQAGMIDAAVLDGSRRPPPRAAVGDRCGGRGPIRVRPSTWRPRRWRWSTEASNKATSASVWWAPPVN